MMRLGRRRKRQACLARTAIDPQARDEVDRLFSPPVLWRFRDQAAIDARFSEIITASVRRGLREERPTPATLTAAVSRLSMDGASWRSYRFGDRAWQADAWRLYDITGQLRFVANWVGNSVSRCDMYVAELTQDGKPGAAVDDPEIAALAAGPLGSGDSRAEALRLLGIDLFVPGEAYIVVEAGGNEDGSDLWWVVTSRQIKRTGDQITVVRSPMYGGGTMEYRDGVDLILRVWTPHPADTSEPDSPTRSAIPDLREMEALRKREFAELDSRLAGAGLLGLPDSLDLPRGDDDPAGVTGFFSYLMRAASRSLRDRSSAEAMVPIMITGPADDLKKIVYLTFWSELSEAIGPMRESALRSLAQSLDIPPEVLLGLGGTNHWSAWAISDEAVQTQIKPVLSRIAAALTVGYLHPALEAIGVEDFKRYVYHFDTAPLTTRPNRTADAVNLHDRGLLSDEATREAGAWGEESAPDRQEHVRRLLEKLLLANPDAVLSDLALRIYLGLPEWCGGTLPEVREPGEQEPLEPAEPEEVDEERAPPEQPVPSEGQPTERGLTAAGVRPELLLTTVAQLAARRALGLLGGRLVPHSKRPVGVPRYQLHAVHGPLSDSRLIASSLEGWSDFDDIVTGLGVDHRAFRRVIDEYCTDLVQRGMAHDDQLLAELITAPSTRRRLAGARCG
jgi:hypothetical protein